MGKIVSRGDIYYVQKDVTAQGSEQSAGRPAIIVSNNKANNNSEVVEAVYLTSKIKSDLPTHVIVQGTGRASIALCEQISSICVDRIGDFIGRISDREQEKIDQALRVSVGLPEAYKNDRCCIEAERDFYKNAYESLLDKLITRGAR